MLLNPERLGKELPIEITAQVQVNYNNFKQKLAQRKNFVLSKFNESHPLFSKCLRKAAWFQKLISRPLSEEVQIWNQKIFPESRVFWTIFLNFQET